MSPRPTPHSLPRCAPPGSRAALAHSPDRITGALPSPAFRFVVRLSSLPLGNVTLRPVATHTVHLQSDRRVPSGSPSEPAPTVTEHRAEGAHSRPARPRLWVWKVAAFSPLHAEEGKVVPSSSPEGTNPAMGPHPHGPVKTYPASTGAHLKHVTLRPGRTMWVTGTHFRPQSFVSDEETLSSGKHGQTGQFVHQPGQR